MDENKTLDNLENSGILNSDNNETQSNQENSQDINQKKSAADLIIEKLKGRKTTEESESIEELRKIGQEVEKEAHPESEIEDIEEEDEEEEQIHDEQLPNYNDFSREQLIEEFNELLKKPINEIVKRAEIIKDVYYTKRNAEIREKRAKFVEEGGEAEKFIFEDEKENEFKNLYDLFRKLKQERAAKIEAELHNNAEKKNHIIQKIEELINKDETLNKTFEEFQKLREEWNNIGSVPQADAKTLLENYNFTLQKFYDWVKINKELRDFDLKRNLDLKIKICEEAESLLIEPKLVRAYKKLQKLHDRWKEIGPVPTAKKDEVWNRFKEVSTLINKNHYEYFQKIKEQQTANLKAKELLCEEAENIANGDYPKSKDWAVKTEEINELLKLWKLIGFAPKKDNNIIFERFIAARKKFFDRKREFSKEYFDDLEKNLQLKQELIVQAENAKNSTEWDKTTKLFVELQNRWKQIGAVPNAKKDEIWQQFNSVCNFFFERKRDNNKSKREEEDNNLKLKTELVEKIKAFELTGTPEENLKSLQDFQKQWSDIGFVPIKQKETIYKEYKQAIDDKFKQLNISFDKRKDVDNATKLDQILKSDRSDNKLRFEIDKVKNKIADLNSEIITLENNLSFFVKSKGAEGFIENFKSKIEKLKAKKEESEKYLLSLTKAYKDLKK